MTARIRVGLDPGYDVVIGAGLLAELVPLLGPARRVAVVHPAAVAELATSVVTHVQRAGLGAESLPVPEGEAQKDIAIAVSLWDRFAALGLGRNDAVVAVGGAATTDLAGFAAATWLRGIRVVHLPTSLLAMVDGAIGGKTALNTPAGKNLVGAFHQPAGVLCDLETLRTLPAADYRAGLAEVVKVGFTHDPAILDLIEADPGVAGGFGELTAELVTRAVAVKADVVAADPCDRGARSALNYGHTLAHAIEAVEGFRRRHGEAVSIGLCFVAELARQSGHLDDTTAARHRQILEGIDLPTTYDGDWEPLRAAMALDKKAADGRLEFVVLNGLARPNRLHDPAPELLAASFCSLHSGSR